MSTKTAAGTYHGKLVGANVGKGGQNNTARIELNFEITHIWIGRDGVDWDPTTPIFHRRIRLYLTDKALAFSEQKLQAMGFNGDFENISIESFEPQFSKGVDLVCEHKQGQKDTYEDWDLVLFQETFSSDLKDIDSKELDRLSARFKQNQDSTRAPVAPPGAPAGGQETEHYPAAKEAETAEEPRMREPGEEDPEEDRGSNSEAV